MRTKRMLIPLVIAAIIFLAGCVATPYHGGTGHYRGAVYGGYGYQLPYTGQSYLGGIGYYNGGHRHLHRRHGHHGHIGGGHQHSGRGHWGGGHRGGHHHRR